MITSISLIVIALIVFLLAIKLLLDIRKISNNGTEVKGVIFDVESVDANQNSVIFPIVRFVTKENIWITKSCMIGTIPNLYKKGKEVIVVYQINEPNNFFIKDNFIYLIPMTMLAIGVFLVAFVLIPCYV
jgi:hypothetical protein